MSTAASASPAASGTPAPAASAEINTGAAAEAPAGESNGADTRSGAQALEDLLRFADGGDSSPVPTDDAAGEDADAAAGDGEPEKAKAGDGEPPAEDADVVMLREINARSRARRAARAKAARASAPAAAAPPAMTSATPPPATAPQGDKKPEAPAPAAAKPPTSLAEKAVADILKQVAELAGDDAVAAASGEQPTADDKAARSAALAAIETKLAAITDTLKETEKGKEELAAIKARLEHLDNVQKVRTHITRQIDAHAEELPKLASGERHVVVIDGKKVRASGVELVEMATERFLQKFKTVPNVAVIARQIEKKLANGREKSSKNETTSPSRKTVSTDLSSPPAARTGPDRRTKAQVEADLFGAFGITE